MELEDKEMKEIVGGAITWEAVAVGGGIIALIIGIISGYTNPTECNN